MAIGTLDQLFKSSKGVFPKKPQIEIPEDTTPKQREEMGLSGSYTSQSPWYKALERRRNLQESITGFPTTGRPISTGAPYAGGVYSAMSRPIGTSLPTTETYNTLYSKLARPAEGLSGKGKYGGFYTSQDLTSAIEGTAKRFKESGADLYAEAMKRYTDVDKLYNPERQKIDMGLFKGTIESPKAGDNYLGRLNKWYSQNVAPAEEYLATRQQIESTPISDLATQIASSVYGMNPDLARSQFASLDEQYANELRDKEYIKNYGVPYKTFQENASLYAKQIEDQRKADTEEYERQIGAYTNLNPKNLSGLTGMTTEQVFNTMYGADNAGRQIMYEYKDPMDDKKTLKGNATGIISTISNLISQGNYDAAYKTALSVENAPDEFKRLVKAMLYLSGKRDKDITDDLILAGVIGP